jgi:hypothetical protein
MPEDQSPAHYINSSKGCHSITESVPLCFLLVLCATVAALPVVEPHYTTTPTHWRHTWHAGVTDFVLIMGAY